MATSQSAAVSLTPRPLPTGGVAYLIPIEIGTPRQSLDVWLSTADNGFRLLSCESGCYDWRASSSFNTNSSSSSADKVVLPVSSASPSINLAFDLLPSQPSSWPGFAAGRLGPGPSWQALFALHGSAVALELNGLTGSSRLRVANRTASSPRLQFSSQQQRRFGEYFGVDLIAPSLCGASLLGAASVVWPALVDTTSACLGLPAFLFDHLFSWLTVAECGCYSLPGNNNASSSSSSSSSGVGGGCSSSSPRCRVPAASVGRLPPLTFRVYQHAPQLQLPLEALLLPADADGALALCIDRLPDPVLYPAAASPSPPPPPSSGWGGYHSSYWDDYDDDFEPMIPKIRLGTMVLEQFVTHLDMRRVGGWRVGLEPKSESSMRLSESERAERREASCAVKKSCVGLQTYVAASNRCAQPTCSAIFQMLDEAEGVCRWHFPFKVGVAIIITMFGLAELTLQALHSMLPSKFASGEEAQRAATAATA